MVTFHTNHGDIVIKTFDDKAPETVKNFLDYCREGFYNNTIFHRVINEVFNCFRRFVIKGFDYDIAMISVESNHFCILFRYCGTSTRVRVRYRGLL